MRCKYCDNESIVEVRKMHGMKISFEHGIQVKRIGKSYRLCQLCFDAKIWNKNGKV